jgi:hypothetical protein
MYQICIDIQINVSFIVFFYLFSSVCSVFFFVLFCYRAQSFILSFSVVIIYELTR